MVWDVGLDLVAPAAVLAVVGCRAEFEGVREGRGRSREMRGEVGRELISGAIVVWLGWMLCYREWMPLS